MADSPFPDEAQREMCLLGVWYRSRHFGGYRRPDEKHIGSSVDPETGLERSEADLRAPGQAIRGPDFVFSCPVLPDKLAEETLLREEWDGSTPSYGLAQGLVLYVEVSDPADPKTKKKAIHGRYPTDERGRAEEELSYLRRTSPELSPELLLIQGRDAWTEEEAGHVAEMTYRWQRTMIDFASKGWLRLEPPFRFESDTGHNAQYARGVDDRGLPYIATVTPEGLDEAERRVPGTHYAKGATSQVAAMSGEQRAKVMAKNPWAHRRWLADEGAQG